jgi:hypothetical protein
MSVQKTNINKNVEKPKKISKIDFEVNEFNKKKLEKSLFSNESKQSQQKDTAIPPVVPQKLFTGNKLDKLASSKELFKKIDSNSLIAPKEKAPSVSIPKNDPKTNTSLTDKSTEKRVHFGFLNNTVKNVDKPSNSGNPPILKPPKKEDKNVPKTSFLSKPQEPPKSPVKPDPPVKVETKKPEKITPPLPVHQPEIKKKVQIEEKVEKEKQNYQDLLIKLGNAYTEFDNLIKPYTKNPANKENVE